MQKDIIDNNIEPDFSFGTTEDLFSGFTPLLEGLQANKDDINKDSFKSNDDGNDDLNQDDDELPEEVLNKLNGNTNEINNDQLSNQDSNQDQDQDLESYDYSYKEIAGHLADIGLLDSLDEDDYIEDTPEALELAVRKTVYNSISNYKDSIPEIGKQFLDYLEKGGDPNSFLNAVSTEVDYKSLDLENESNQKLVLKEYFKTQDWSEDEIQEAIEDYEDGMILKKRAEKAVKDLQKINSKKLQELQEEQDRINLEKAKNYEDYINTVKSTIKSSNQIAGLQINDTEKAQFEKYLLEVGSDGTTAYIKEVNENPIQTQLELAYLKFKKFDFSKVAKEIRTKETRNFKRKIVETDKTAGRSINRPNQSKAGSLSAFRDIIS